MTRKKVNLEYITSDLKRKATFRKRKKGLIKKISEITTLCGIEACAIIDSQDEPEAEPEVWPSEEGVESVISKFRGVSELEQGKKMFCQESFLRQTIIKTKDQLKKVTKENRKKEMSQLICQYFNFGYNLENADLIDLKDIAFLTDHNLLQIRKELEMRQAQEVTPVIVNEGETMNEGNEALVNHAQETESNADAMQTPNRSAADNNINGGDDEDVMLTLEDVNVHSGWLNQYIR